MSFIDDVIRRSREGTGREEDYAKIYYAHTGNHEYTVLVDDHYKDYWYTVESDEGRYPVVKIMQPDNGLSVYAGKTHVHLKDRNGVTQVMTRNGGVFFHIYNQPADYEDGMHPGIRKSTGRRYTVEELVSDAKAFIDQIIKDESEFTNHMDD